MKTPALLVLEDGSVWHGRSCGAPGEAKGELVFNTSMMGYQEVLTDPSYKGQLVTMTYPLIGNYGITAGDNESRKTFLEAFIVRELCRYPSNWESIETAGNFLQRHGVKAIEGVDTRAITLRVRDKGALRAILSTTDLDPKSLLRRVREVPAMVGLDLAREVTCESPYEYTEALSQAPTGWPMQFPRKPHVVVMDFGAKFGIMRSLNSLGCHVTVVPANADSTQISALRPDGVMLSNGPGDPEPVTYAIETIKRLIDAKIPIFGICLGHQLLALALGAKTYKLKFGHHGANHPVMDLTTGRVEVTTQNHGFCVDAASMPKGVAMTHVNLNDQTCEGLAHSELSLFSVQHHPEAAAGPHDARYLFSRFGELMLPRLRHEGKPNRRVSQASEGSEHA